ncbi:MAG: hypothetical protein ACRD8O_16950 [Bryobacteraceae bacterium]
MSTTFRASFVWSGLCALSLGFLGSARLSAEESGIQGPVSGFVLERKALRPMLGIPGSAHLGDPLAVQADAIGLSPEGSLALLAREGWLALLDTRRGTMVRLETALESPDRFAWNSAGDSVAVYSSAARRAEIWRDMKTTPRTGVTIDLAAAGGPVSALAFDGVRLLVGTSTGVYRAGERETRLLTPLASPVSLALNGKAAFAAAPTQIWQIEDYAGAATPMLFLDERTGIGSIAGIRVAGGGKRLVVAGARSLDLFEIDTRNSLAHADLDFDATRLEGIGSARLAALNITSGREPLYIVDFEDGLGIYFVPAGREQ